MAQAFDNALGRKGVFDALLDAAKKYGANKPILEDQERTPLTYTGLIRGAFALGRKIAAITSKDERVGLLLPSSSAGVVTFTSGIRNLRGACAVAGVKRVLTSHRFIEQGKLHDLIDALEGTCQITYLEDVRASVGAADKAFALAASLAPRTFRAKANPDDPGVVLFTSGSFGAPRGVILRQRAELNAAF